MHRRRGAGLALALTITLGLAGLAGCSGSSGDSQSGTAAEAPVTGSPMAPGAVDGATADRAVGQGSAASGSVVERSVITTVATSVSVADVAAATAKVVAAATVAKGYVENQFTTTTDEGVPSSSVTVRIPGPLVDQFLSTVSGLGTVVSTQRSATDVTAEVADIDARLANARAGVVRLRQLMAKATKISDIVAIESALSERQAEAESLAAQQRALADQTSLATVTVELSPEQESAPTGFLGGLHDGWEAFQATVSGMARLTGMLLPFALVAAMIIGLVLLLVRRGSHRHPQPAPVAAPPYVAAAPAAPAPAPAPDPAPPAVAGEPRP